MKSAISRRRFTKSVAAGVAGVAPILAAMAQTPVSPPKEPAAPPNPQPSPLNAQQPSSALVEAYAALATERFGERFNDEQIKELKSDIESTVRNSERLKAVKLQNSEEPDFVFEA